MSKGVDLKKVRIYWRTKKPLTIQRIKDQFKIYGITVNGESVVNLKENEMDLLKECEKRGFLEIREIIDIPQK